LVRQTIIDQLFQFLPENVKVKVGVTKSIQWRINNRSKCSNCYGPRGLL